MMPFLRGRRREPPAMTLEGVLGPNGRLDEARGMKVDAPDAVCVAADRHLLFSSGARLMALDAWGGEPRPVATFDAPVTALCAGPDGRLAIGLAGGRAAVLDASGRPEDGWALPAGSVASVVDCAFLSGEELLLVDCGYGSGDDLLARAAWDDEARGQLVALGRSGQTRFVASGLHCPMGVSLDGQGGMLVPLLERAGIADASGRVRQGGYPGYLGRLRKTANGYVLACLSRRDPLIEFLKTEHAFVAEMKAKIEPRHWIAPRANPEFSHDFPIELGATRLFGEVKPWAPSFSYGLLIELDASLMPVGSAQSRANGRRHAICDVADWNGELIAVSRASGEILNLGAAA
ncbi:MAG: hypothetical protein J0H53_03800 [Rhizobiales bacterium]|nr:hypothetical protein [Hyphomicrobiales bacterium]OJU37411.1 MAG: hypothetical protein BGN94_11025 [Rhizobiales bacterium 68-8]